MTFGITASNIFGAVVALDRLIAILNPVKYRTYGLWYLLVMVLPAWAINAIDVSFIYITMDNKTRLMPACTNVGTYSSTYSSYSTWVRVAWTAIAVFLCLAAMLLIWKKVKLSKNKNGGDLELLESIKTISVIVAVMLLTQVSYQR